MEFLETISKMALAGLAVWRLTRTVHGAFDHGTGSYGQPSGLVRLVDCLYWVGIWMSAQTALWVACGLGGVLLNWLAFSGVARFVRWSKESQGPDMIAGATGAVILVPATKDCNGAAQLCL